jgi:hypothetical protein
VFEIPESSDVLAVADWFEDWRLASLPSVWLLRTSVLAGMTSSQSL